MLRHSVPAWLSNGRSALALVALPALAIAATLPVKASEDLTFSLYNDASEAITELYLVPYYADTWEDNLMPSSLAPGGAIPVVVADGLSTCTYDIGVVFWDGSEAVSYDVDLCETASFTVTD